MRRRFLVTVECEAQAETEADLECALHDVQQLRVLPERVLGATLTGGYAVRQVRIAEVQRP